MQRPFVFGIVILGLSCAAWWGARNPVAGTEPPVIRAVLKQAPKSEVSTNAQVLVKTKIFEADRDVVNDAWTQLTKKADTEHKAEAAKSTFLQAAAFSDTLVTTVVAELSKHPRTSVKSEPSITVISGHVASFISGGEFAVPTIVGVGGTSGTTTSFRSFGTSMIVNPSVLNEGQIRLALTLEESSVDQSNSVAGIPGINVRRVNTNLLVNPGQAIVMVLPTQPSDAPTVTEAKSGVKRPVSPPSKKADDSAQRSLFVIVTAEIAKPMEAVLAAPTVLPASREDVHVLTPYAPIPWRADSLPSQFFPRVEAPNHLLPVTPWPSTLPMPYPVTPFPGAWPYAGPGNLGPFQPQPIELSRLQHLESAKHHLEQAGLTDDVAAVQKAIKLEQQSATRREVQRRERELEQLQKELDSLRGSLSEESDSSQSQ